MAGSVDLDRAIVQWLEWDKNPKTLAEVRQLNCDGDIEQLQECFGSRMKFGTAGMRSIMGPGFSHMNDLTIIQTTQGLCRCLEKSFPDVKDRGVVIGFDARAHPPSGSSSQRFARFAATVLVSQGIPVYLFSQITPTPFVPFTVSQLKLCAGIMITASHNPKQDNGYKVYWDNGAQIVEPHDREIAEAIDKNLEPWSESWNDKLVDCSSLVKDPFENMKNKYLECLQKHCFHRDINKETKLKFVHTSVHGVGHEFVQAALKAFSFTPPLAVPEQKDPDPEFPTVKYPNPEEGKDVLTLSFALADKEGATVILANDPDADRLAVAEKQESGEWKVFSGNELGALLGWWNFTCWKKQNPESSCLKKAYMLSSTVSSKILRAIALKEGFHFEETLTGFKWMGNKAKELIDKGNTVLFAFEEAIGYMSTEFVLDKDGVSAAAIVAELASYLATKNTTLSQNLKAIYEEYGYHLSKASYFICHNPETIDRLFQNLRKYNETNQYPKTCGKFEISDIRDLTTGYDSSQPDKNAVLPTSKSSQMITFTFKNGCVATMRTSGTEPKIKYYAEICAPPGNSDFEKLKEELNDLVNALVEHFFQPDKNGLTSQST
ncbi:phosphoglucomutase-2 isoform X1 [Carcharodon carcharias]|uniref:phosphoglucomutase-2 isoform X1 n=1 Tax=Carcharodon carcharias TaxID=13397 RepID=UPI001B7F5D90|nr:phosphoglucomutase-2 isoform X1 [Carcharodon carcharias]